MNYRNIMIYSFSFILLLSCALNIYLYKENRQMKTRIGMEFQHTVQQTFHEIDPDSVDFWEKELQTEHGHLLLERYIGNLRLVSEGYQKMNLPTLTLQIRSIQRQLYELKEKMDQGEDSEVYKEELKKQMACMSTILNQIESDLGNHYLSWYQELTQSDSKTSKMVQERWGTLDGKCTPSLLESNNY